MEIQHLKYPFYHTIIYNYFDNEYQSIYNECAYITSTQSLPDFTGDDHHTSLVDRHLTKPFLLDSNIRW